MFSYFFNLKGSLIVKLYKVVYNNLSYSKEFLEARASVSI